MTSSNNNSVIVPNWLSNSFFREIIQEECDSENVEMVDLKVEPVNNKGENFSSIMLRAEIKATIGLDANENEYGLSRSYIVKLDPVGLTRDVMNKFSVFPKEIEMYTKILPALSQLYQDIGEEIIFSPRCLRSSDRSSENVIVLEDLRTLGYRTANRQFGLDIAHAELALELLAKFHAASAVYYEQVNTFNDHFQFGLHADHMKPILYEMYRKNIDLMREVSSSWKCHRSMDRFLDNYEGKMLDKVFELIKTFQTGNQFKVLCHGDFWCNNVMFKYEAGSPSPSHCYLIDYQLTNFNSPAFDLNYFIFTSMRKDIKLTYIDSIIHFYHTHLVANLEKLHFRGRFPKLSELHRDFQDLGAYGLNSSYGTLCAVVAPTGKDADMNSLLGDDEKSKSLRRSLFSNPLYVEALEQLIPYFERKGVF